MSKRIVEVFITGCAFCDETVKLVRELSCSNCDVQIWDLRSELVTDTGREKAAQYGIYRVPAVVVNGRLAECCQNQEPISREQLVAAGVGQG